MTIITHENMRAALRVLVAALTFTAVVSGTGIVGATPAAAVDLAAIRQAVVKIHTRHNPPSYLQPWNSQKPSYSSGTGFFIGKNRILTNAHVVSYASDIEVELDDLGSKLRARIKHIAHDADLALLELEEPLAKGRSFLTLKGMPKVRDQVLTVGYPKGGEEVSFTEGIVSRVSFRAYAHSPTYQHLLVQVDSAINSGNSGGPVLRGDAVIGVAFQAHSNAENTGYIIPTPVVNRFLKDVEDGRYDGHPYQGILFTPGKLENAALRQSLGVGDDQGGVVVDALMVGSPWQSVLQADDILVAIEGQPVKRDGTIDVYGESLSFLSLLDLGQIGDTVRITRIRQGKSADVKAKIALKTSGYDFRKQFVTKPSYFVLAGLMFRPLSRNLLTTFGAQWYQNAPLQLRQLQFYGFNEAPYRRHKDFVILYNIYSFENNDRFGGYLYRVVSAVQGQPVTSFRQFVQIMMSLLDPQKNPLGGKNDVIAISFYDQDKPLLISADYARKVAGKIMKTYRIPTLVQLAPAASTSPTSNSRRAP